MVTRGKEFGKTEQLPFFGYGSIAERKYSALVKGTNFRASHKQNKVVSFQMSFHLKNLRAVAVLRLIIILT